MEFAAAAVGCISLVESSICMVDNLDAAELIRVKRLIWQLESSRHGKRVSDADSKLPECVQSEHGKKSGAVMEVRHQICACNEGRQQSLHTWNGLDDTDSLLESGVVEATSGTCPTLAPRKPVSWLEILRSILNRQTSSTARNHPIAYQRTGGEEERLVCEGIREVCDLKNQECAPDPEKRFSCCLLASDQTGDRTRAYHAQRWHTCQILDRGPMAATRLTRLLGSVSLLYPSCMVVMSNYAITRGLFAGSNSWAQGVLQVSISSTKQETAY
jgi:hypothetical protein